MSILKRFNLSIFIYSLLLLGLGICLVAMPEKTMLTICYVVGAFSIVLGITSVVEYFVYGSNPFGFVAGLFELCFGLVFIFCAQYFVDAGIFAIIWGLVVLFMGIYKVQESMNAQRAGIKYWWVYLIYSIAMILLSILIIVNPFSGQKVLLVILGITFIMDAICEVIMLVLIGDKLKKIRNNFFNPSVIITPVAVQTTEQVEEKKEEKEETKEETTEVKQIEVKTTTTRKPRTTKSKTEVKAKAEPKKKETPKEEA